MRSFPVICLIIALALSSCTRNAPIDTSITPVVVVPSPVTPGQPEVVPVETYLHPTRQPGQVIASPTPNQSSVITSPILPLATFTPLPQNAQSIMPATMTPGLQSYTVLDGEYPGSIAEKFGVSVDDLLAANKMNTDTIIYPGDSILIPNTSNQSATGTTDNSSINLVSNSSYFKIIPDSELVYGPLSSLLDVEAFIKKKDGYLAYYTQDVDGETLTGAQIIIRIAQNYSVNPRLLLALLEYRANWVTNANPAPSTDDRPISYIDDYHYGLFRQLSFSADRLNEGFYRWQEKKEQSWTLIDGTQIVPAVGINPGTAAVQHLFAMLDDQTTWAIDTGPNGLFATYNTLFGYPFDLSIEPLLPTGLSQPTLALPFHSGEIWQFTGGPHAGWVQGSAWAALDFAPPGDPIGCGTTEAWTTAVAPGLIIRANNGAVLEDLDGDGIEQTGWTILYMHMENRDRVQPGTRVQVGDKIGHPSCEGGEANAAHLHLARRYNGVWISAADPKIPFVLDGYVASGSEKEYDGWLKKGNQVIEAWDGINSANQIKK